MSFNLYSYGNLKQTSKEEKKRQYAESLNNHNAQYCNPSTFEEPKHFPRTLDFLHGQQAVTW